MLIISTTTNLAPFTDNGKFLMEH